MTLSCDPAATPRWRGPLFLSCCRPSRFGRNSFGASILLRGHERRKKHGLAWLPCEDANLELRANFFNVFNQLNLQPIRSSTTANCDELELRTFHAWVAGRVVEFQARFRF